MKKRETEREYLERIGRLVRGGRLRSLFRQLFSFYGIVFGSFFLLIGGLTFAAYLRLGGSADEWHFVFGLAVGLLLCPGIFAVGSGVARALKDVESVDARPFTLMVKYHDQLVREGFDPYETGKS